MEILNFFWWYRRFGLREMKLSFKINFLLIKDIKRGEARVRVVDTLVPLVSHICYAQNFSYLGFEIEEQKMGKSNLCFDGLLNWTSWN